MNHRPRLEAFLHEGEWRMLDRPNGPPTWRQLLKLNALGCLELVEPGQTQPITKGEAAYALHLAAENEPPPKPKKPWAV